jgi:hypothetical protein
MRTYICMQYWTYVYVNMYIYTYNVVHVLCVNVHVLYMNVPVHIENI